MPTLEEAVIDLQKLDDIRSRIISYRDEARTALATYLKLDVATREKQWLPIKAGDQALILKALCHDAMDRSTVSELVGAIGTLSALEILGKGTSSAFIGDSDKELTSLQAARLLAGLASSPTGVFADSFMVLYYAVIRDLYYADAPEWIIGGARGGARGTASAYVTTQAIRGLSAFVHSLERTAIYIGVLAQIQEPEPMPSALAPWQEFDRARRRLFLNTTLARHSWNLALPLLRPVPDEADGAKAIDSVGPFLSRIRENILEALKESERRFKKAATAIDTFRCSEEGVPDPEFQRRVRRSASAHTVGREAVADAVLLAGQAREVFRTAATDAIKANRLDAGASTARHFQVELEALKELFNRAAVRAKRLLAPAEHYLSSVLDRNLARALSAGVQRLGFDAIELACASASVAAISDGNDERLLRAAECLTALVSDNGFPKGRPFHRHGEVMYEAAGFPTILCYADLLDIVPDAAFAVDTMRTIERYFQKRRTPMLAKDQGSTWHDAPGCRERSTFDTALAALALARIARLLDRRINQIVLSYFRRRKRNDLQLKDLFYGDYGKASKNDSIAITLERMCAHLGSVSQTTFAKPLFSAIFYGPPGTGKTTLVEALASSASADLVEVTPSDIVVRGADAVEERARAVFQALSFLTNAVILFDEFEEVLVSRATKRSQFRSIFHFLTPGMLPKLKELNEAAARQRLVYILLTNHLATLDRAAIRPGRFDAHVAVYPPDVLSRAGRLWSEAVKFEATKKGTVDPRRFSEAIRRTVLRAMEVLGKPGCFTRPRSVESDMMFAYLTGLLADFPDVGLPLVPLDSAGNKTQTPDREDKVWREDDRVQELLSWDNLANGRTGAGTAPTEPLWMAALIVQLDKWANGEALIE